MDRYSLLVISAKAGTARIPVGVASNCPEASPPTKCGRMVRLRRIAFPQAQTVTSYLCPSDNAAGRLCNIPRFTEQKDLAKGNYAAYVSPQHVGDLRYVPGALGGNREGMPCRTASYNLRIWVTGAPRSLHAGGVVAVAMDEHAGFMSDDSDTLVLSRMISANDRTPLDMSEHLR